MRKVKLMRYFILTIILLVSSLYSMNTIEKVDSEEENALVLSKENLKRLFEIVGVQQDGTVKGMNEAAQSLFLRPKDRERYQENKSSFDPYKEGIIQWAYDAGLFSLLHPKEKEYDYIFIHGSLVPLMESKILLLKSFLEKGLIVRNIILLSGERELSDAHEKPFSEVFKFEYEAGQFSLEKIIKKNFPTISCIAVNALQKNNRRPNTQDTIEKWFSLDSNIKPGRVLAISSVPFHFYQDQLVRNFLQGKDWFKKGGTLETIGAPLSLKVENHPSVVSNILDTVARYLYEVSKRKTSF